MRRLFQIFFLSCVVALTGRAQDSGDDYQGVSYYHVVKIVPLRFLSITEPGFEASVERIWDDRWGVQASAGLITNVIKLNNVQTMFGYSASVEGRWYYIPLDMSWMSGPFWRPRVIEPDYGFISLGGGYSQYTAQCIAEFEPNQPYDSLGYPQNNYQDAFRLDKDCYFATLRFGKIYEAGNFKFEFSFGVSAVYRNVVHSDRLHPGDKLSSNSYSSYNFFNLTSDEGTYWTFRLPVQFKIGYAF